MGTATLRITDGYKTYHRGTHEFPVFHDVDLEVQEGEVYALLGPSGCGKSTLLRIIAGLEHLTRGDLHVNGAASGEQEQRRAIGIAFQQPNLFPWLTVAENVELGLRFQANVHARRTESVDQVLREFGIDDLADAYPSELSGGQAQRVSLARTVVTHPRVLLLDEPFGALDPRTRAALQDWLLEIQQRRGLTVVIVTHDVNEALYLGHRVGLMSPGPGTITHTWGTSRLFGRDVDTPEGRGLRREILARYGTETRPEKALVG